MSIQQINSNYGYKAYEVSSQQTSLLTETEEQNKETASFKDGFVKETNFKPDTQKIYEIKSDMNSKMGAFKAMVQGLFQKQGTKATQADNNMKKLFDIDAQTKAEAEQSISDDGYWGVEATANRILDFAKALSGGDPTKAAALRDAVKAGFKAAKEAWGGELPSICGQTYDRVMKGFDEWEKQASATE